MFVFLGLQSFCPKIVYDEFLTRLFLRRPWDVQRAFAFGTACFKLLTSSPRMKTLTLPGVSGRERVKHAGTPDNNFPAGSRCGPDTRSLSEPQIEPLSEPQIERASLLTGQRGNGTQFPLLCCPPAFRPWRCSRHGPAPPAAPLRPQGSGAKEGNPGKEAHRARPAQACRPHPGVRNNVVRATPPIYFPQVPRPRPSRRCE